MNLDRLWKLTKEDRESFKESENLYFDCIGLNLFKAIQNFEYWCTPTNSITFASTGGDGVHFGLLCEDGKIDDNCPIVMTMPSAYTPNMIVGENFLEFLSLGCRCGFFTLEQIEYDPKEQIALLDSKKYPQEIEAKEMELLKSIENEFMLKPWSNHSARLDELKEKYLDTLKYSDEYYEISSE